MHKYTPVHTIVDHGNYRPTCKRTRTRALPEEFAISTGKELDAETGFYYYGARYLDPKTSRWISADPALGDYIPSAPVDDEAKKRNGSLPGQGGVFNHVNLHVYHYAGNNPVKYVDPDGETPVLIIAIAAISALVITSDVSNTKSNQNKGNVPKGSVEIGLKNTSLILSAAANVVEEIQPIASTTKDLIGVSNAAGIVATLPSLSESIDSAKNVIVNGEDPVSLVDPISDLAISTIGFIPVVGPLASSEAEATKKAIVNTAKAGTQLNEILTRNPFDLLQSVHNYMTKNQNGE
jgi:RHS repeat-associated protein